MRKQDQNIHNLGKTKWRGQVVVVHAFNPKKERKGERSGGRESMAVLKNQQNNCVKDGTADVSIASGH